MPWVLLGFTLTLPVQEGAYRIDRYFVVEATASSLQALASDICC